MIREMPSNWKKILTIEKLQNNKHFEHHDKCLPRLVAMSCHQHGNFYKFC